MESQTNCKHERRVTFSFIKFILSIERIADLQRRYWYLFGSIESRERRDFAAQHLREFAAQVVGFGLVVQSFLYAVEVYF